MSSFINDFKPLINPLILLFINSFPVYLIKIPNINNNYNSVTDDSLLILLFNTNGLRNSVHELETVLNKKRIGIALISKTHFTIYSKINIQFNQYKSS